MTELVNHFVHICEGEGGFTKFVPADLQSRKHMYAHVSVDASS